MFRDRSYCTYEYIPFDANGKLNMGELFFYVFHVRDGAGPSKDMTTTPLIFGGPTKTHHGFESHKKGSAVC
jgi:hypothetical protein